MITEGSVADADAFSEVSVHVWGVGGKGVWPCVLWDI